MKVNPAKSIKKRVWHLDGVLNMARIKGMLSTTYLLVFGRILSA